MRWGEGVKRRLRNWSPACVNLGGGAVHHRLANGIAET